MLPERGIERAGFSAAAAGVVEPGAPGWIEVGLRADQPENIEAFLGIQNQFVAHDIDEHALDKVGAALRALLPLVFLFR